MNENDRLVEALRKFHEGRQKSGLARKYERLNQSAFSFFRGTAFLFAKAWRQLGPEDGGPPGLISGDLHLENFGCYLTPEGEARYDINDFDEAIFAPCGFDVVRCATSTLLAAEDWQLGPTHGTAMVLNYLDAYRQQVIADHRRAPKADEQVDIGPLQARLDEVERRTPEALIEDAAKQDALGRWRFRTKGAKFAPVTKRRRKALKTMMRAHGWELVDVVRRFAGVGSLGLRRYQVLARDNDEGLQLLSLKQASPSAVRAVAKGKMPKFVHQAERVIWAEQQLRGASIEPLAAVTCDRMSFRLRAMIPDENRADLNRLAEQPAKLRDATAAAGRVTARAHWRGCRVAKTAPAELYNWATNTTLEAVLAAAVRMADRVFHEFELFQIAYKSGAFEAR